MNIKEIQQAIAKLPPDELTRFREWLMEYENKAIADKNNESKLSIEDILKRLKGSLKGKGGLKTLMEERRKESLL